MPTTRPARSHGSEAASPVNETAAPTRFPEQVTDVEGGEGSRWADREASYAAFVRSRWARLVRLAYPLTLDVGRAEDLVQESLAKLWPVWPRLRDGNPEAYVRRVIVNGAISASRRRWRGEEPHWDVPDVTPTPGGTEQVDERDWLRRELAALSVLQRAVVVLRYVEDLSEQQVADLLDVSTGTVKTHAARGLARLRQRRPVGRGPAEG
jgi:RNA polymerase sigma-70 factor (sigma-E family)